MDARARFPPGGIGAANPGPGQSPARTGAASGHEPYTPSIMHNPASTIRSRGCSGSWPAGPWSASHRRVVRVQDVPGTRSLPDVARGGERLVSRALAERF